MSTGDAIRRFLNQIEQRHSSRTYTLYKFILRRFEDFMPRNIEQLTREHIEQYLFSLKNQTNRSINCHLIGIKSFCRSVSEWWGLENPAKNIRKLPEAPPKQRILSKEEYTKILSACDSGERDVITFLSHTGLRDSEFQSLKTGNFNSDHSMIHIVGKGQKRRSVSLSKSCQKIINSKPDDTMYLLKSYQSKYALANLCMRLSRRAAIPRFGPHSLRHYFADSLRREKIPIYTISKLLGHSSIKTTEIYLHQTDEDLKGVTDVLDEK